MEITTVDTALRSGRELELDPVLKSILDSTMAQLPELMKIEKMHDSYRVVFPEGLVGELMQYKNGMLGTPVLGENGKIVGHAGLVSNETFAVGQTVFAILTTVVMQQHLADIGKKLSLINTKVDKILEFLYGDKKAELIAEVNYANYVQNNFSTIMSNDLLRRACITNLQQSRKVAIRDIEFYISDLESLRTDNTGITEILKSNKAFSIKDSLELSLQLLLVSSILETYLAGEFSKGYLQFVRGELELYISRCEKVILSKFSAIRQGLETHNEKRLIKKDLQSFKTEVDEVIFAILNQKESFGVQILTEAYDYTSKLLSFDISAEGTVRLQQGPQA